MKFFISLMVSAGLILSPLMAANAQSATPNLGDDTSMTLGDERHLGDEIAREMYRDPEYVSDPVLDGYLNSIWHPLYEQAKRNGSLSSEMDAQYAWHLFLIRDKSVNAFALPGGYFGVHLGLIALTDTPDEFASVLAHETTHVTQRHISRGMTKESAQMPWLVASMLVGLLAARSNPQIASAAFATGQAAAIQGQLNFSRDFEREADRIGFTLMAPAGYDPEGFVAMFDMLEHAARLSDNGSYPYLRTHPLTTERIADMRARVGEFDRVNKIVPLKADSHTLSLHHLMAARAAVLADLSVDAQRFFIKRAEVPSVDNNSIVNLYAAALAAWNMKDRAAAHRFYERLKSGLTIKDAPNVVQLVHWLGAELQEPVTLNLDSESRVEMLYAVQQLLASPRVGASELRAVTSRLQEWLANNKNDVDAWNLLSRVHLMQNQRVRAAIASAESLRAQEDDPLALAQYKAAQVIVKEQGSSADPIDAAIVDSKVRELQALERAAAREKRR